MIRLALLGPTELTIDGEPPPRELTWRKNLGLLAYLVRSPRGQRSRGHLIEAFWPDRNEKDGRHSLNEALRVIRKHLPDGALATEGEQVRLDAGALETDLDGFEAAIEDDRLDDAAGLVRGPFMAGFTIPGSNTFEDWLSAERRSWARHAVDALVSLGEARLEAGDPAAARHPADRARAIDPVADAPVALLLRCEALAGSPSAALATFRSFAERLDAELGLEPPTTLTVLADRIAEQRELADEQIRGEEAGLSRRLPLTGRGEQMKLAMQVIRRCRRESEPSLLLVSGPPGTGKTRFGEELTLRAELEGFRVAHVRCDAEDRDRPHEALRLLLATDGLDGGDRGPDDFHARVEAAAGRAPVLLWIDDAQHLGPDAVARLAPTERHFGASRVLVLISATTEPPIPPLDELAGRVGRSFPGEVVALDPLAPADLRRLAHRALPAWEDEAVERLTRRLHRDTGGLPLLAVDLLHALRLGLEPRDDAPTAPWPEPSRTMDQTFPAEMPAPLVAAIRVGFRRLSPAAQDVLKAGAMLKGRFTADDIGPGVDLSREETLAALDEAEWRRWLLADPRGYKFVARLHREVIARDMMTSGQRQRLQERLTGA